MARSSSNNGTKHARTLENKARNKAKNPVGAGPNTANQSKVYTCAVCGCHLPANKARFDLSPVTHKEVVTCNSGCSRPSFNTGLFANAPEVVAKAWPKGK